MDHHGGGSGADFKAEKRHEMVSRVTPLLLGGADGDRGLLKASALLLATLVIASLSGAYGLASLQSGSAVTVWDNVLPKETCKVLHDAAAASGLGHSRFRRHNPHTVISVS